MKAILIFPILAALVGAAAQAQPAQPGPPRVLIDDATALAVQCHESGGKTGRSPGLIKLADLTGDGQRDYVMDLNHYNCEGAASAMSAGQSGAAVTIYVGGPGNTAREVWHGLAFDTEIKGDGPKARLWLTIQGLDCGQKNAANLPMAEQKGCVRPLNWNAAKQTFVYAPLAEAKAPQ